MEQQQILVQIADILKIAYLQADISTKNPEKFSAIEADLLKDYLRIAYDKLNVLTYLVAATPDENIAKEPATPATETTEEEAPVSPEIPEVETSVPPIVIETQVDDNQPETTTEEEPEPQENEEETPLVMNEILCVVEDENIQPKIEIDQEVEPIANEEPEEEFEEQEIEDEPPAETVTPLTENIDEVVENQTVADTFQHEVRLVGEQWNRPEEPPTILSKIAKTPLQDLRKAIGINDRFTFINELFKGNISAYNLFIDEVERFDDGLAAWEYVEKMRAKKNWDGTSSAYKRLFELIERKFNTI